MHIYNTLTRRKEPFKPLVDGKVSMYVCGMTVYDYCHLGHARVMVAFDVITRYLRHRGYDVTYVRNITDIDDKILKRAEENGEPIDALTERMIAAMHEDEARLNVLPPSQEPRATRHIDDIIAMIETLIDKGFAYAAANGDVYYRVRKFTDYGKLNNRQLDDMRSGARVDVDVHKEDPLDFVLWKAAKPGEAHWHSPWGDGRPGWHIECSAMSTCCLGDTFDIHGGGPDLTFPHHENEIAQSESFMSNQFAKIWMHVGMITINGEKMSKSLGNVKSVNHVLENWGPNIIRLFCLSGSYSKPIDYSEKFLKENITKLRQIESCYYELRLAEGTDEETIAEKLVKECREEFDSALNNDLNTPLALTAFYKLIRKVNSLAAEEKITQTSAEIILPEFERMSEILGIQILKVSDAEKNEINQMIKKRDEYRMQKNYEQADSIRAKIAEKNIIFFDHKNKTTWVMQEKIKAE